MRQQIEIALPAGIAGQATNRQQGAHRASPVMRPVPPVSVKSFSDVLHHAEVQAAGLTGGIDPGEIPTAVNTVFASQYRWCRGQHRRHR